jgi:hypothetical protein
LVIAAPSEAQPRRLPALAVGRSHPAIVALGISFVVVLAVGLIQGPRPFYADAQGYWELASSFTDTGHFSLLNYGDPLRGYSLPLAIYVLKLFTNGTFESESDAATLFNIVLFSLIGAVLTPRLAEIAWPQRRWGLLPRLALTVLLLVFWSGDLSYPLTDFPGLTMALVALVAISRSDRLGWMLLAGIAAGLAINLRPAYLPLIPMLFVIVALNWLDQRGSDHASSLRRALCVSLLIAGLVLASLPQSLSEHRYFGTWDPIPGSRSAPGSTQTLTEEVLTKGMSAQRWDSFERPAGVANAIAYPDPAGKRLLEQQPEQKIKTWTQYFGLIVSHPTIMIPMLVRRLVNGLDTRYSTIYVEHSPDGGLIWLRVGGWALVFLALVRLLWPAARRRLGHARWRYPLALTFCCLSPIASAIEARYMLPVVLLSYVLTLAPGWPNPIGPAEAGWRRFRVVGLLALAALVFGVVLWHMLSAVHSYTVYPA